MIYWPIRALANKILMISFIKNIYRFRELLIGLSISYIKARYKQTILGIGWAIVPTIILVITVIFVFPSFKQVSDIEGPYLLFVFIGFWVWTFFSSALSFAIPNLVQNVNLLRKIYFPREILVVAAIVPVLIDYSVGLLIIVGIITFYKVHIGFSLIILPIVFLIQVVLTLGISLMGSIVNVAFRDVSKLLPTVMQVIFFISPIIYPVSLAPEKFRLILLANPLSGIIESYRSILLNGIWPDLSLLFYSLFSSIIIFVIGYYCFKKGEQVIADII